MAITFSDIKKMSIKAKAMVVILVIFLIGYLDWFYFLSDAMEKKTSLDEKLAVTQEKIKEKEQITAQINKYIADVAALQENYKIALQKLPDQREIPNLFHSISLAGKDAGVDFLSFEPKASIPKVLEKRIVEEKENKASTLMKPSDQRDQKPAETAAKPTDADKAAPGKKVKEKKPEPFYEEIPVGVSVVGTFQNILYFFDKVAKLPRIINISDITISERTKEEKERVKEQGLLMSTCTIKTYMFIEKKEKETEKTAKKTK
jgi:type IV pilus assembly protein PilO